MSGEKFPGKHETYENILGDVETDVERQRNTPENTEVKREKAADIEEIRRSIEEKAKSTEQIIKDSGPKLEKEIPRQTTATKELKEMAFQRLLIRTRKQLPLYDRAMSHIIHSRGVDATSEAIGKTVARPSGILGGGLLAFIGTLAYYFIARHYGYNYNSFIFLGLLGLGFVGGWTIEVLWRMAKRPSRKSQ